MGEYDIDDTIDQYLRLREEEIARLEREQKIQRDEQERLMWEEYHQQWDAQYDEYANGDD